jgi:hypothetical protein
MIAASHNKERLLDRRAEFPELTSLLGRIESVYQPVDVLLFGSRSRGDAKPDSDWDIMVIIPDDADEALLDPGLGWRTQSGSGVHADLHCCFRGEFIADLAVANSQAREVVDHAVGVLP